jgi:hypothetical protein
MGHPFQPGWTYITQKLMAQGTTSEEIIHNYKEYMIDLAGLSERIQNCISSNTNGHLPQFVGSPFNNRIFEILSESSN